MPEGKVIPFNEASLEIIERRAHVEGSATVALARDLVITDAASYVAAGELRKEVNRRDKILEDEFKPIKQSLDQAKKKVLDFEKKAREPLGVARGIIDEKLVAFQKAQERIRQEQETKLREIAAKAEEDRRLAEAQALVDAGVPEEAALATLDAPSTMPAPSLPSSVPKVPGISFRETWGAEVLDLYALVCFAAMHPEMVASLVLPNGPGLNALARAQKGALNINGVRAVKGDGVSGSRR